MKPAEPCPGEATPIQATPVETNEKSQSTILPPASGIETYTFQSGGEEKLSLSFPVSAKIGVVVLSAAERSLVNSVLSGKTDRELALERQCSSRAIAKQLRSICAKLKVKDRQELVQLFEDDPARLSLGVLRGSASLGGLRDEY